MSGCFTLVLWAALSGGGDVTLVEFTDPRCQPCRAMEPVVQRLASEKFDVRQVDVTRQPQLARQYGIVAYPTFVLFAGDREVQRFAGMTTYDDLVRMIARGQAPTAVEPQGLSGAAAAAGGVVRGQSPDQLVAMQADAGQQRALAATVRLKVEDEQGWGVGTGTIIDTHFDEQSRQYEALVLTCGHLFKSTGGKGKIEVDLFAAGARSPVQGELLDYDEHLDVALVSIWPGTKVAPAKVASPADVVRAEDIVFTVGCSEGKDPTIERSKIHAVNRYSNRPNFTVGGRPAQGRSGGGLFNERGMLIGVCNSDDPQDGEGIYAGLAAVHAQLDKFNLQAVYQRNETLAADSAQAAPENRLASAAAPLDEPDAAASSPVVDSTDEPTANREPARFAPQPSVKANADETELVCILRTRSDVEGTSEVFVIDRASAELIQRILDEAKATGQARLAARQQAAASPGLAGRQRVAAEPLVRGQSAP